MTEARWVLAAFGAISKAFLDVKAERSPSSASPEAVPAVDALLPKGMPEAAVFQTLAASKFTCATDSDAATCFRSYGTPRCEDNWSVRLIFGDDGTVWSTGAASKTTCL